MKLTAEHEALANLPVDLARVPQLTAGQPALLCLSYRARDGQQENSTKRDNEQRGFHRRGTPHSRQFPDGGISATQDVVSGTPI